MADEPRKTFWQHLTGWAVVGAVSILFLGSGIGMMAAPHPYIADSFFFVGFALLLIKFWTWEETKHDTPRKTALLLAGVSVLTIVLFAGSCLLSYCLNLPKQPTNNATETARSGKPAKLTDAPQNVSPPVVSTQNPAHEQVRPKPSAAPLSLPQATPASPTSPTYGGQTCIGSACAQGPNSQATLNQFGAPKLLMSDAQRDAIRDAMTPYAGIRFSLFRHDPTPDSYAYADQLKKALTDAGLVCEMDGSGMLISSAPIPSGVSVLIGANQDVLASTLAKAMGTNGLLKAPLPAERNSVRPDGLNITVAPNR